MVYFYFFLNSNHSVQPFLMLRIFFFNSNTLPACLHLTSGQNDRCIAVRTQEVFFGSWATRFHMHYSCFLTTWSYNHTWLNNATTIWRATHNSLVKKMVLLFPNLYGDIKQVFSHHKAKQTQLIINLCQVI